MNRPAKKSVSEILGVPPLAKTGRDRLVAAAIELFYRNGFVATGIDRVIAEAGVTKTTFYKHFESKDELMVAAVKQRDAWETSAWLRVVRLRGGNDPAGQMLAWVDVLDEWFNAPDYAGCMFMNAAAEFPNPHDPVHQAAAEHMVRVRTHWHGAFVAVGTSVKTADTLVDCFLALIEGALMMRQTSNRNDAARAIRPGVQELIKAFLPSTSSQAITAPALRVAPRRQVTSKTRRPSVRR
jgi:AcrR family transcriptional regulator